MKVYVLRFITQTQGQWKVFFREPDKFSADLHQAWNLHLLHIRQEQSSCRQGCSSNVVGTGICSVYSTTSSDFTVKIFCSDPLKLEPHAKRQFPQFRRTLLDIMCSRRPDCVCFFSKVSKSQVGFLSYIQWLEELAFSVQQKNLVEAKFRLVKSNTPQLLAEMEERQNSLREPAYT